MEKKELTQAANREASARMEKYGELMRMAEEARKRSYCPYSGFSVGAALLAKDGTIFTGCNIENAAYGPSNCAERTAFFKAVSEGVTAFSAIAVTGAKKGEKGKFCAPCGVCRQVMAEFCSDGDFAVILRGGNGLRVFQLKELLPEAFGPSEMV